LYASPFSPIIARTSQPPAFRYRNSTSTVWPMFNTKFCTVQYHKLSSFPHVPYIFLSTLFLDTYLDFAFILQTKDKIPQPNKVTYFVKMLHISDQKKCVIHDHVLGNF
jgi:hypothetical protein